MLFQSEIGDDGIYFNTTTNSYSQTIITGNTTVSSTYDNHLVSGGDVPGDKNTQTLITGNVVGNIYLE